MPKVGWNQTERESIILPSNPRNLIFALKSQISSQNRQNDFLFQNNDRKKCSSIINDSN